MSDEARAKMSAAAKRRGSNRTGVRHTDETRRLISERTVANTRRGAEHYAWKGGSAAQQKRDRKSPGYKSWRNEVRRRAGGSCESCQSDHGRGRMHAHHLESFATHPHLRLDPDNGAWLCDCCHASMH